MPFGLWRKKAQITVDRQRQVDIGYVTRQLAQGDLSFVVGCNFYRSVVLTLRNISLMEPRLSQSTEGGIKEKIAKGLYSYVSQPKPAEPVEELVEVDRGSMIIRVDEVVFAGTSRHVGVGFGAIESISFTDKGITIATWNSAQKIHFEVVDGAVIPLKVQDRTYDQPLSGKLMRLLVEAVIKISLNGRNEA
jgi:hypothetical protein